MEDFDYPGVYGLSVNGEILYVGSSKNIKKRIGQHFSLLRKGMHKKELQDAYCDGKEIVPVCLEKMTEENTIGDLYSKEIFWIDKITPTCTERKPTSSDPLIDIYKLAKYAAKEKEESKSAKYDYLRVLKENHANTYYSSILYHAVRYFTPIKDAKNGFTEELCGAFVVSPTYEDGKNIRAIARKKGITEEQYILEAVRQRMESEK